jgi:hypothetical protein
MIRVKRNGQGLPPLIPLVISGKALLHVCIQA